MGQGLRSGRGAGLLLILAATLNTATEARGAHITEIVPGGGGFAEAYVEITPSLDATAMDLLVLEASVWQDPPPIHARVHVDPGDAEVIVLHQGPWTNPGASNANARFIRVDDLALQPTGSARRLALFERPDGAADGPWPFQSTAPGPETWVDDPAVPPLLDVVTYTVNGPDVDFTWQAEALLGESLLDMAPDSGASRIIHQSDWTDQFLVGSTGGDPIEDEQSVPLTPGVINIASPTLPEPSTLMLLASGVGLGLGRPKRRRI